jgi:hypothetical protein
VPSEGESDLVRRVRSLVELRSETRNLAYRAPAEFGPDARSKGELVKSLMAFANTADGGHLLVGVGRSEGGFVVEGVSMAQASSFDPSVVADFARSHCSAMPPFRKYNVWLDGSLVVLIDVLEFTDEPIVCTNDLDDVGGRILRNGALYVRTDAAESVEVRDADDMHRVLRLAQRKHASALLRSVREIVGDRPLTVEAEPRAVDPRVQDQHASCELFFVDCGVDGPHWQLVLHPEQYDVERFSRRELRELRQDAEVAIRGWDVPHADPDNDRSFEGGIESWTNWSRYLEAHRFYRSGFFGWRRRLSEDLTPDVPGREGASLTYVSAIYSVTEQLLFASRLATAMGPPDGQVVLDWEVTGLADRKLWLEPGFGSHHSVEYASGADALRRHVAIPVAELETRWKELAVEWMLELCALFDFSPGPGPVRDWQRGFLLGPS